MTKEFVEESNKKLLSSVYVEALKMIDDDPKFDNDGDVEFKGYLNKELKFVAVIDEGHKEFLRVCMPVIYRLKDSAEKNSVLAACNFANVKTKVAKVYLVGDTVWAAFEMQLYKFDVKYIKDALMFAMPNLESAASRFSQALKDESV